MLAAGQEVQAEEEEQVRQLEWQDSHLLEFDKKSVPPQARHLEGSAGSHFKQPEKQRVQFLVPTSLT
jgi:hypothetical protein